VVTLYCTAKQTQAAINHPSLLHTHMHTRAHT